VKPSLRALLALLVSLVAPPAGWLLAGHPLVAAAWLLVPMALAVVRLGPGLGVLPVALHDPVMWLSLLLWIASAVGATVVCARGRADDVSWRSVGGATLAYIVCARLVLGVPGILVDRLTVRTGSMAPTLLPGDGVLVAQGALLGRVGPGDVVVVDVLGPAGEPSEHHWIKRVVAVGGQEVAVTGGRLVVDGRPVPLRDGPDADLIGLGEGCAPRTVPTRLEQHGRTWARVVPGQRASLGDRPPLVVPEGHVYLVGDYRDRSMDSRRVGPLEVERIRGRVLGVASLGALAPCPRLDLDRLGSMP